MARARRAAALMAVGLAACASAGDAAGGERLAGCYRLERSEGAPPLGLPWGVELRGDSLEGWGNVPGALVALTLVSATETADHPLAYWTRAAGDSIRVGHPGGGGLTLTLVPVEGGLAGWGRAGGDALVPGAASPAVRGPVTAHSVACETSGT